MHLGKLRWDSVPPWKVPQSPAFPLMAYKPNHAEGHPGGRVGAPCVADKRGLTVDNAKRVLLAFSDAAGARRRCGMDEKGDPRENIRVSAAALCRIEIEGRFLLEVNKNRGDILTPLGGAYEFEESARPFLNSLGARFEKRRDIRLTVPSDRLAEFDLWFRRRAGRETLPVRELREELVDEHRALDAWDDGAVSCRLLGLVTTEERTSRRGTEGALTRYFYEVFEVLFSPVVQRQLAQRAEDRSSRLRLATRRQIETLGEVSGLRVASHVTRVFFEVKG